MQTSSVHRSYVLDFTIFGPRRKQNLSSSWAQKSEEGIHWFSLGQVPPLNQLTVVGAEGALIETITGTKGSGHFRMWKEGSWAENPIDILDDLEQRKWKWRIKIGHSPSLPFNFAHPRNTKPSPRHPACVRSIKERPKMWILSPTFAAHKPRDPEYVML